MTSYLPIAAAFLIGSIPFSFLAVRLRTGRDLRLVGSGNPGATNALRTAGPGVAVVGLILDIAKGFLPVWLGRLVPLDNETVAAIAVAAVLGHVFSPILRFHGGKGVATAAGALGALNPLVTALAVLVFVLIVIVTRYVSLSSILGLLSAPVIWLVAESRGWITPNDAGFWAAIGIALVVVVRHWDNMKRLRSGSESRLGESISGG